MLASHDRATNEAVLEADELPTVGETIGGYRLDRLIATGGMGAVFAAVHTRLGREAAVKVLDPQLAADKSYVSRFLHEARVVNDVRHPNIVDIYDFIETDDGRVAFVMELLDGPTLSRVLVRRGRFSAVQALNVTRQLLDALASVHAAGIVHRDLKPQNVVLTAPPDSQFWEVPSVKILDFGIAKHRENEVAHRTTTGSILGTPAYMAPEQVAAAQVSPATDLYAVAEILFELTAGRRLFEGENLQILSQKLKHQPPSFELPDDVDCAAEIVSLTRAAIAPDPEQRPSAEDFKRAVDDLLEDAATRAPTGDAGFEEDGAATVLNMPMPRLDDPEDEAVTDSDMKGLGDDFDGGMNTQMFFDRIAEDIADVDEPEAPAPEPEPEPLPSLALKSPLTGPLPKGHDQAAERPPPVIRGTPNRPPSIAQRPARPRPRPAPPEPPRRRFLWLLLAPALLTIAAVALPGLRRRAESRVRSAIGLTPNPVRRHLAAWRERHPDVSGSADEHFAEARAAHVQDRWSEYEHAEAELEKALILDPDHAPSIALYAENALVWKADHLTDVERADITAFVDYLLAQDGAPPAVLRAEALLAKARGNLRLCAEKARAAREGAGTRDPLALLIEAECTIPEDGARAASLIWSATEQEPLGRAVRLSARASARTGHFREALDGLEARLEKLPKNGPALLTAASILHSVGQHDKEIQHLRRAVYAEGNQLQAQLRLGEARGEIGRIDAARQMLEALAGNEHAPDQDRRAALVGLARLELQADRPKEAAKRLEEAKRVRGDPIERAFELEVKLAVKDADAVLAAAPFRNGTELIGGGAHVLHKRPDEAKHLLETLVQRRPRDARAYAHLAGARALLDDFAGARKALDRAVFVDILNPIDDDGSSGSKAAAKLLVERLEAIRDLSSDHAAVDGTIALLHFYAGQETEALERAIRAADQEDTPVAALILVIHLTDDPGKRRAATERLSAADAGVAGQLAVARALAAEGKSRAALRAYGRALASGEPSFLARVEQATLKARLGGKSGLESMIALHVSNPRSKMLRRMLYELAGR